MTDRLDYRPAIVPLDATEPVRGVWEWSLGAARVCAVGVQADPLKDSLAWWERQQGTMPTAEFLREYGLDFGVYGGKPCLPEYQDRLHAAMQPLAYATNRPLLRGWDIPGPIGVIWLQVIPVRPRAATQQTDWPSRVHVLAEWLSEGSIEQAARQVQAITAEQFPDARDVVDWADPAAFDRRANDHQSCADILRRTCGIHIRPGPRTLTERLEAVRRWLLGVVPNAPAGEPMGKLLIDPSCQRLKEALRSGYRYKALPGAQARYHELPEKNWASHLCDALQYALGSLTQDPHDAEPARGVDTSRPLEFTGPGLGALIGPGSPRVARPRTVWDG
jgi:hypothetical protein